MNISKTNLMEKEIVQKIVQIQDVLEDFSNENNMTTEINLPINNLNIKEMNNVYEYELKIQNYVKSTNPFIAIMTPCYGGLCHSDYTLCLVDTVKLLEHYGILVKIFFCNNDSLVSRARNNLIGKAMLVTNITHFIFIDADICWNPVDILKLLISGKELIGGIYPKKSYKLDKIISNPSKISEWIDKKNKICPGISDELIIRNNLVDYNLNYASDHLEINENIIELKHIATGFMMIKREVIDKMIQKYPETKYIDDVGFIQSSQSIHTYALFDCAVIDGHYYSEDWVFCHRWSGIGEKIYADISIDLIHIGIEYYQGSFMRNLLTNKI